jgi:hypothetical protein
VGAVLGLPLEVKVKDSYHGLRCYVGQTQHKVIEYSNLVAFCIEPITARLLDLIEDDEFNVDNFMTYHLSLPIATPGQSSPLSNVLEQDTPLTSNLSELSKNVRSRQLQRINVRDPKNAIP